MPRSKDRTHTPAGNIFLHGQLHLMGDGTGYRHTGSDMARSRHEKVSRPAPIAHGMKRQTKGALHPHLHGQMIDDETDAKLHLNDRSPNIHPGMGTHRASAHERGIVAHVEDGSRHLQAAGVLGRQDRVAADFDPSFVHHKIDRKASLPASKSRRDR